MSRKQNKNKLETIPAPNLPVLDASGPGDANDIVGSLKQDLETSTSTEKDLKIGNYDMLKIDFSSPTPLEIDIPLSKEIQERGRRLHQFSEISLDSDSESHAEKEGTGLHRKGSKKAAWRMRCSNSGKAGKKTSNGGSKRLKWLLGVMIFLFVLVLAGFITSVVILSNGNRIVALNYFESLNKDKKLEFLRYLIANFGVFGETSPDESDTEGGSTSSYVDRIKNNAAHKGAWLAGYNSYSGINLKYQADPEISSLMATLGIKGTLFYGVAYAPRGVIEPKCGSTQREILLDLALLSRVTTRVRNYGMQCNQSELILNAIQELHLNMTLAMGVWIGEDPEVNKKQMAAMKRVLKKYPRNLFECIFIGNEVLFREEQTSHGLSEYIKDAKSYTEEIGYSDLPVGTSEIGSLIDKTLVRNCDIIGANIHPFFAGGDVLIASKWVYDFIKYQVDPINKNRTEIVITEVGWPYKGGKYQHSIAEPSSFQTFLNDWVCEAYERDYGWYFFEAFDEPWKRIFYEDNNKWETEWGIFTKDRKQKSNIQFPKC